MALPTVVHDSNFMKIIKAGGGSDTRPRYLLEKYNANISSFCSHNMRKFLE